MSKEYEQLAERLRDGGRDVEAIVRSLTAFALETPSWGYGDSGTRFATFRQAGRPRDVFERLNDAAEVHRLTGTAPAVALHFPWDQPRTSRRCARHARSRTAHRRYQREPLPGPRLPPRLDLQPRRGIRRKALEHLLECVEIAAELDSTAQSLWLADGTNYPGQDDLAERRERIDRLPGELYAALPEEQELLLEYKFFEPAFYATDLADWGSALLALRAARPACARARRPWSSRAGHQRRADRRDARGADRLGGFHFNNRKYADDDLIVGSVNPFELF